MDRDIERDKRVHAALNRVVAAWQNRKLPKAELPTPKIAYWSDQAISTEEDEIGL